MNTIKSFRKEAHTLEYSKDLKNLKKKVLASRHSIVNFSMVISLWLKLYSPKRMRTVFPEDSTEEIL